MNGRESATIPLRGALDGIHTCSQQHSVATPGESDGRILRSGQIEDYGKRLRSTGGLIAPSRRHRLVDAPPLTCRVWPLTYDASSLARKAMTAASSSGWPTRRKGVRAATSA